MSINYKIREFAKYKERLNRSLNSNFGALQSIVEGNHVRNLYYYMQNHQHFRAAFSNRNPKACTPNISSIYRLKPVGLKLPLIATTPHKNIQPLTPYESLEVIKPVFQKQIAHRKTKSILYTSSPVEKIKEAKLFKPNKIQKKIIIKRKQARRRSIDSSGLRLMYN